MNVVPSQNSHLEKNMVYASLFIIASGITYANYFVLASVIIFCIRRNSIIKIKLGPEQISLAAFAVLYTVFCALKEEYMFTYLPMQLLYFLYGYLIICAFADREATIKSAIWSISLGLFLHVLLAFIISGAFITRDEIIDIWTGELWSPTGLACHLTVSVSLLMYCWKAKMSCIMRILMLIQVLLSIYFGFWCGTRTLIIVAALVCLTGLAAYWIDNKKKRVGILFVLVSVIFVIALFYIYNVIGLADIINNSSLIIRIHAKDITSSDMYRLSLIKRGLIGLFEYPFGGNKTFHYAHNLWLDVGRQAGILPFFALVAFFVAVWCRFLKNMIRSRKKSPDLYLLVGSIYLGFSINCFAEPILEGARLPFLMFTLITGLVTGYFDEQRSTCNNMESNVCMKTL